MKKKVVYFALILLVGVGSIPLLLSSVEKSRFEKLELFNKVLFLIETQYYRQVDTEKLISGAIKGMMSTLDPHSAFLDKEVFIKVQEDTSGEFGGLGIEVTQKDGVIVVITPIDDTPAFRAGIKTGDKIVEIDHEQTIGITLEQAVEKMRGAPNSKITIGIIRNGVEGIKRFVLKRESIKIKSVKTELMDNQYGFIRLSQFQKGSAESISEEIKKLRDKAKASGGLKGLILDLRSNPGGLLDEAVDVSSIFMRDGIVVSTEGRDPKKKEIRYVKKEGHKELELPLVLLINGASASASEIVAGALQDDNRAIIMGNQSFGKGSVQTVAKIDDEKGVKLTIAQYMTPKGRKIQAIGITPDVVLGEYEGKWVDKNKVDPSYIRERDLRNHLTATVETKEEKQAREEMELSDRKSRIEKLKQMASSKKEKSSKTEENEEESEIPKNYSASEDYQVLQAVNYLKSLDVFKRIN